MKIEDKISNFLNEGTWSMPSTVKQAKKLQDLFKHPLIAKDAIDKLYNLIGDDDFYDQLDLLKDDYPKLDIRKHVANWIKDNWLTKIDLNTGNTKDQKYGTWVKSWEKEALLILMDLVKKWA